MLLHTCAHGFNEGSKTLIQVIPTYIYPAFTTKERNAQKEWRKQLQRTMDAGEAHLRIICGKIIKNVNETIMAI